MTVQLVSGQNVPWPDGRVTAYVEHPTADLSALVLGASYRVRTNEDLVFYNAPRHAGVEWLAGPPQGVTVDLAALAASGPEPVEHVMCVMSLDSGTFAGQPPRLMLLDTAGTVVAEHVPAGLSTESAVVTCEIYRHGGGWKVRAVGQGYDGGLAQAVSVHGVEVDAAVSTSAGPTNVVPTSSTTSVPDPEAILRQSRMILEDASRTTASLLSTKQFAAHQLEGDLEQIVGDPDLRVGPVGDRARAAAQRKHDDLVNQARANHTRDLAQLTAELAGFEANLPAPLATWHSPTWASWQPADEILFGFRLGELSLPDAPEFRMPLLTSLPLGRPIWIEPELGGDEVATRMMRVAAVRLVAAMSPAATLVSVIDIGGRRGAMGFPNAFLAEEPVTDVAGASQVLGDLVNHLDLVTMAVQSGTTDSLDPIHSYDRLVLINDFPVGLDESALRFLHRLIEDGPRFGVHVIVTGTHSEALDIPLLSLLHRMFFRIPSGPGGDLVDGFGGVEWTFVPDAGPVDPTLLDGVLQTLLQARSGARRG